ncbi:MAG: translocation/assembly module TamB domain-containing protein [Sulfitobacter sp.]
MRHLFVFFMCLVAGGAAAQDDDKDWLTRTIQDALSGKGRSVEIEGFQGALTSAASFERMTIADEGGTWLTLEGAELVWNRSALLRGRLEVENLTADMLEIARLPEGEAAAPSAEAEPFSLPNLPVSIQVSNFEVSEIRLGAPILGEPAVLKVTANAQLTDSVGLVDFDATRIDGKRGHFKIKADMNRDDQSLVLDMTLSEEAKGIVGRMLDLPGQPSVDMTVAGNGPLTDFASDVELSTDGKERLTGKITIGAQTPRRGGAVPDRRLQVDIGGDITAVIAPEYREFFGTQVGLKMDALMESTGAMELSEFSIDSAAAQLQGKVTLNAEKWPSFIDIEGSITDPDGGRIALPGGGGKTFVERMALEVEYDASNGEAYRAAFDIAGLANDAMAITHTTLSSEGTLQGNAGSVGQLLGTVLFDARGITVTDTSAAEALGDAVKGNATLNYIEGQPMRIEDLTLQGDDYGLTGRIIINGLEQGFLTRLQTQLQAEDLSRFSALIGRELDGKAALALKGMITPLSGEFDLNIEGSTDDLAFGIEQADAVLAGRTELSLSAKRDAAGTFVRDLILRNDAVDVSANAELSSENSAVTGQAKLADIALVLPQYSGPVTLTGKANQDSRGWSVDLGAEAPYGATATVEGLATGENAALNFAANVPQIRDYVADAPLSGTVSAAGVLRQSSKGWQIVTDATAPQSIAAHVEGLVSPNLDIAFDLSVPQLRALVPQVDGPLKATGQLRQTDDGFYIDTNATGPYGARAAVEGLATGPNMALDFDVAIASVSAFAPGIRGGATAKGNLRQTPQGIVVDTNATGPYAARAAVQGLVTGPDAAVQFSASLPNIGALVEQISGPLDTAGTAQKTPQGWQVAVNADGPSGTNAVVAGLVGNDGNLNLTMTGAAPLGLSAPFIAPRNLQGQAQFDLALNGPAAVESLSGTIRTSNATLSAPALRLALQDISAAITLSGGRAQLDVSGAPINGGRVAINGSVATTGNLAADIGLQLQDVVLIDPRLYRTSVSGALRVAGPLTGGAQISGRIDVGETQVNVPSTGLTSIGDIPQIAHVGATNAVQQTRAKAGLVGNEAGTDVAATSSGAVFGLNILVSAPNRIFVRGRGLDAELGGALTLTGTTGRVISAGEFELLRGRLDILGKRFDLREGAIQFEGDLIPYLYFVSATDTDTGEVRVIVKGPANEPEVVFESSPDGPQDEVLSQLLFGRNISEISAFQALQLANAVAVLAGKSGGGVVSKLRDGFGLDDLDVATTDDGTTALRAGKYLTDNIYTDVTTTTEGEADVSLNLDLTDHLKAKISVGSNGDSGLGVYFEKDY